MDKSLPKKQVTVSLVNYNSAEHTLACVDSIHKYTSNDLNYEIVVVDNQSEIDDFKKLETLASFENVRIIRNNANRGFSGGHMTAVEHSHTEYFLFQNNDSYFLNDYIGLLLDFALKTSKIGVLGGAMFNSKNQYAVSFHDHPKPAYKLFGKRFILLLSGKKSANKRKEHDTPVEVDVINGSSMFVKADTFERIGGLDTNFFLYCEEEDLALRMNRKGYTNWFVPSAHYLHLSGKSTPKRIEFEKEFYISFMYYYRKNYSHLEFRLMQWFQFFKQLKRSLRSSKYFHLATFILKGAPYKSSLRFKNQ
jgi:hypothetical protein